MTNIINIPILLIPTISITVFNIFLFLTFHICLNKNNLKKVILVEIQKGKFEITQVKYFNSIRFKAIKKIFLILLFHILESKSTKNILQSNLFFNYLYRNR